MSITNRRQQLDGAMAPLNVRCKSQKYSMHKVLERIHDQPFYLPILGALIILPTFPLPLREQYLFNKLGQDAKHYPKGATVLIIIRW